jgi:hypothetical protein
MFIETNGGARAFEFINNAGGGSIFNIKNSAGTTKISLGSGVSAIHAASLVISSPTIFTGLITQSAGVAFTRRSVADSSTTLRVTDFLIAFTLLNAGRKVTLPSAASAAGQHFVIKDESGSAGRFLITIVGTVDGTINPTAVNTAYGKYKIYSNGTSWFTE